MSPVIQGIVFTALFLSLLSLEYYFLLRDKTNSLIIRLLINILLSIFSFIIVFFVVSLAAKGPMEWSSEEKFGIIYLVKLPSLI